MSLPISTLPGKRRVRRKRRAVEASPTPPPPAGLAVVGVTELVYGGDTLNFNVVFNTTVEDPLVDPVMADAAKWTARYNGETFEGASVLFVQYDQINIGMLLVGSEAGANVVNYSNAPSDIADSLGRELAAFSGYPL